MTTPRDPSQFVSLADLAGLPAQAGLGFKIQHFDPLLADGDPPGFIEVHAENYMGAGGMPHAQLQQLRERLPISIHGVGLSIGGMHPPDPDHLDRLAALLTRYQPASFSEHLAWSTHDGRFFNDLLPLCYDDATLHRVCEHVDRVQARLGRRILIENPSSYFDYPDSTMGEPEFIAALVARTGCGLLLDVNNVFVSCHNNRRDAHAYLDGLPINAVAELHLAGHAEDTDGEGRPLLIDNHGAPIKDAVWRLFAAVLARTGPVASLIEWDTDVPDYATLRGQARRAQAQLDCVDAEKARAA